MPAYYNEIDPFAAVWLRELIKAGLIADGEVDTRSITDVQPDDLRGFVQCHFFAGIGGWSYALRLAGWGDDEPAWTGSCPCQPFSSIGAQAGGADARHLWPTWFRLIAERRPVVVFGEQVESAITHGWLDLVCDDLEGAGYACGPVGLPSASVGAFDIRARLWFVADAPSGGLGINGSPSRTGGHADECESVGGLADADCQRRERERKLLQRRQPRPDRAEVARSGEADELGNAKSLGYEWTGATWRRRYGSPDAGHWRDCDWLPCADGKARPVEPGTFPLAHGIPARVGRLRGYGNAINPEVAAAFIEAYRDARGI